MMTSTFFRKSLAGLHVALDVLVVGCLLLGIWHGEHDDVGPLGCIGNALHGETCSLGLGCRGRTFAQTHYNLHTAFLEVERMGVTL